MNNGKRWYEKNPELSELIAFVQTLDEDDRVTVAQHLLQILVNECGIDLDVEFSKISLKNYSYNRWYDEIFDLSSALELLKNLPENKQEYVIKRFLSEIIMSYAKKEL
ncbi:hypothetical protein IJ843_08495 [bacterium]|nr:hypothetical protein [bacterium]